MNFLIRFWEKVKSSRTLQIALIVVSMFLFILIMDKLIMPWYTHHGDEIDMLDVIEMKHRAATATLEKQGFNVIIADSIYDEHYEVGTVVEQMPLPHARVKIGRNVYLKVSIGEKPIIMPNLFSLSPRDAELKLRSYNLELKSIMYAYNDLYPEGAVIAQSYPQGQKIKKGSEITITVSLGEMPKEKTIPLLVGKSLSSARSQLRLLGVRKIQVEYQESENMLPETILKQSLPQGEPINQNTSIELLVSKIVNRDEEGGF